MIYPDPGIESEPPPPPNEASDTDPTSLRAIFRKNGLHMVLVVGLTLAVLGAWVVIRPVRSAEDGMRLLLVQLWVMAVLMPLAAHKACRAFDALCRAGVTDDAFGGFMVVFALVGGQWSVWDAVKLYLLVSAVGLLLIGLLAALRCTNFPAVVTTGFMAAAGCVIAGYHTLIGVMQTELPGALDRVNLIAAAGDAMGVQKAQISWIMTFSIYGAAAGLCWSWLLIAGQQSHGEDEKGDQPPASGDEGRRE